MKLMYDPLPRGVLDDSNSVRKDALNLWLSRVSRTLYKSASNAIPSALGKSNKSHIFLPEMMQPDTERTVQNSTNAGYAPRSRFPQPRNETSSDSPTLQRNSETAIRGKLLSLDEGSNSSHGGDQRNAVESGVRADCSSW
jgi:hypothetical protein